MARVLIHWTISPSLIFLSVAQNFENKNKEILSEIQGHFSIVLHLGRDSQISLNYNDNYRDLYISICFINLLSSYHTFQLRMSCGNWTDYYQWKGKGNERIRYDIVVWRIFQKLMDLGLGYQWMNILSRETIFEYIYSSWESKILTTSCDSIKLKSD